MINAEVVCKILHGSQLVGGADCLFCNVSNRDASSAGNLQLGKRQLAPFMTSAEVPPYRSGVRMGGAFSSPITRDSFVKGHTCLKWGMRKDGSVLHARGVAMRDVTFEIS